MAQHFRCIINTCSGDLTLTQIYKGVEQVLTPTGQKTLTVTANNLTRTGGTENDFIRIPDATPPDQYFLKNHTTLTSGSKNPYIYSQNHQTIYWNTQPPEPGSEGTAFAGSAGFEEGFLVISQDSNQNLYAAFYDVNVMSGANPVNAQTSMSQGA
jgi:hypothetical protein